MSPATPAHPHRFPAQLRIKQRREFLRVQRGGRKHHLRHFLVFISPRQAPPAGAPGEASLLPTRCGITVTRKVGNAVARNQIKRLVREVFRKNQARLPVGLDMVWVAKQQARGVSYAAVVDDLEALLERGQLTGPRRLKKKAQPGPGSEQVNP